MLRIGKLTDYATVILATLAADRSRLQNAGSLAERTHIAAPTVSKLLKQLHRAGLVNSTRGTHGGYQLARAPEKHQRRGDPRCARRPDRAHRVLRRAAGICGIEHTCSVGRTWQRLNLAIRRSLSEISLAQLAGLDNRTPADAHRTRAQAHGARRRCRHELEAKPWNQHRRAARQDVPPRLRHRHRFGHAAAGPRRRRGALHLAQEDASRSS